MENKLPSLFSATIFTCSSTNCNIRKWLENWLSSLQSLFHWLFLASPLTLLSSNPTKWSNTLKQFLGKLPTNRLSVFYHFVGLALKGLKLDICCDEYCPPLQEKNMRIERVADCRTCQNSKTLPFFLRWEWFLWRRWLLTKWRTGSSDHPYGVARNMFEQLNECFRVA